jgi:ribosome-associated translation inhibitor RaiA
MSIAIQISFRGINKSAAVESAIRQHAARLERFAHQIKRLHVAVGMPQHNRHHGNHYAVRIEIATLTGEPFVTHDAPLEDSHKDFQTVLRVAFDAAERHLEGDSEQKEWIHDAGKEANPVGKGL